MTDTTIVNGVPMYGKEQQKKENDMLMKITPFIIIGMAMLALIVFAYITVMNYSRIAEVMLG